MTQERQSLLGLAAQAKYDRAKRIAELAATAARYRAKAEAIRQLLSEIHETYCPDFNGKQFVYCPYHERINAALTEPTEATE